jgi:sulfate adenylyltransferase
VTLLDGDIVRKHLSSELWLLARAPQPQHRAHRLRGLRDHEERRHRAVRADRPHDAVRKQVRAMIEPHGGFLLVHVATPIATCEQRDREGLHPKTRAGTWSP